MKGRINSLLRNLDGKLLLTLEVDASPEELQEYTNTDLEIEIGKPKRRRSLDANALLWALLGELASALHADKWDLYLMMLKRYGRYTYVSLPRNAVEDFKRMYRECEVVGESDERVSLLCYIGSSTYTQGEFSRLLDGVIQEAKDADIHLKASSQVEELYKQWRRS